jgi:hypothetical protein
MRVSGAVLLSHQHSLEVIYKVVGSLQAAIHSLGSVIVPLPSHSTSLSPSMATGTYNPCGASRMVDTRPGASPYRASKRLAT